MLNQPTDNCGCSMWINHKSYIIVTKCVPISLNIHFAEYSYAQAVYMRNNDALLRFYRNAQWQAWIHSFLNSDHSFDNNIQQFSWPRIVVLVAISLVYMKNSYCSCSCRHRLQSATFWTVRDNGLLLVIDHRNDGHNWGIFTRVIQLEFPFINR